MPTNLTELTRRRYTSKINEGLYTGMNKRFVVKERTALQGTNSYGL